jgi:hypothetical protein
LGPQQTTVAEVGSDDVVAVSPVQRPSYEWVTQAAVAAATLSAMDGLEFLRGRVYGADHDEGGPRQGRTYVELVAGPLDGLLLDVTDCPDHARAEDVAFHTEMGRYRPGGRALYRPRPVDRRRFDWRGDTP